MNVLVDANLLLRAVDHTHPMHPPAVAAVGALLGRGDVPCVVPQVLYEFWAVATRPVKDNGLGRTPAAADAEIDTILLGFPLLADGPTLFGEWRTLVAAHAVSGKKSHDTRLAAAMRVHGLTHLLTFNGADFTRYPITVLDPYAVAAPPTP